MPVTFEWHRNGKLLLLLPNDNDGGSSSSRSRQILKSRFNIENVSDESILVVHKLEPGDTGNYTCIARNQYGVHSQTIFLIVKGLIIIILQQKFVHI